MTPEAKARELTPADTIRTILEHARIDYHDSEMWDYERVNQNDPTSQTYSEALTVAIDTAEAEINSLRSRVEALTEALRQVRLDALEEAAKVAENCVRQKCCGHGEVVCDARGEPVSEECCGNPDIEPMYPNEIAASIRFLMKTEDETQ